MYLRLKPTPIEAELDNPGKFAKCFPAPLPASTPTFALREILVRFRVMGDGKNESFATLLNVLHRFVARSKCSVLTKQVSRIELAHENSLTYKSYRIVIAGRRPSPEP